MWAFFLVLNCKWGYALNFSSATDWVGSPSSCSALLTLTPLAQTYTINQIQEPIQAFEKWSLQGWSVPVPAMLWQRHLKPQITCFMKPLHLLDMNRHWMYVYRLQLDVYAFHCFRECKVTAERKLRKDAKLQSVTSWSIPIFSETWRCIKVMDKYQLSNMAAANHLWNIFLCFVQGDKF